MDKRPVDMRNIEINEQFATALAKMEELGNCVFITGKAGTGKSTLLEYFRETTKKQVVVLAPTGVAAVNIGGQTIHSFFRFKSGITETTAKKAAGKFLKRKSGELYQKISVIVIDEVSMVRADLLDCVDQFLKIIRRRKDAPFGGVKMIFIGDLYQLPPVVTSAEREIFSLHYKSPYFFSANVFPQIQLELVELEKIYRQKDEEFIKILNSIRNNSVTPKEIETLNSRYDPSFEPKDDLYIYLTTINARAAEINEAKLNSIRLKTYSFQGTIHGDFDKSALPAELELKLKVGAQVMLLNNDSVGRWINGTIGKVAEIEDDCIFVELPNGDVEDVRLNTWELFEYTLDSKTRSIKTEEVGAFTQFPLKLAWAITIHKSQGKTFDKLILDLSHRMFATGQAYVALSRCRSMEGIVLKHKFQKNHVLVDWRIVNFLTRYQYQISEQNIPFEEKVKILKDAIRNKRRLKITYLKAQDVKSNRVIEPLTVGDMEYLGKMFPGVRCYCHARKEERTFRIDRILEISHV